MYLSLLLSSSHSNEVGADYLLPLLQKEMETMIQNQVLNGHPEHDIR